MGTFKWISFALISFGLLFFNSNLAAATSTQLMSDTLQDDICKDKFCGEGTCQSSTSDILGFNCNCNPGWMKPGILPPCILPNCTVDFRCGNGSPLPAPTPLSLLSFINFSNPCIINLCLDGTCERDGTEFKCQCYEGSANLMKNPKFPCFKKCYFGADCNGLDLGFNQPPPSPPSPPPPANSPSPGTGDMLKGSGKLLMLITIVLATVFIR